MNKSESISWRVFLKLRDPPSGNLRNGGRQLGNWAGKLIHGWSKLASLCPDNESFESVKHLKPNVTILLKNIPAIVVKNFEG